LSAHSYLGKNLAKLDDAEIAANRNGASNDPKADAAVRFKSGPLSSGIIGQNARGSVVADSSGDQPAIRKFRKDWTSAGNRASLSCLVKHQRLFQDPAPPAFAPVRGFDGGGARRRSNRTKDLDNVTKKAVIKQAQP